MLVGTRPRLHEAGRGAPRSSTTTRDGVISTRTLNFVLRKTKRKVANPRARSAHWPPSNDRLEALVKEAIVDAYGEAEQRGGFFTMIEDNLALPFETEVLGVMVTVERIDLPEADEIVAICRRGGKRQSIPVLDLPMPEPPRAGAEWKARKPPGRKPDVLKIEGTGWKEAIKKSLKKKRPTSGWPKS